MSEVRQVVVCVPGSAYGLTPAKDILYPVLQAMDVPAGDFTALAASDTIDLSHGASTLFISAFVHYHPFATAGARIHVHPAPVDDPAWYDTIPWDSWDLEFGAGMGLQQSASYETCPAFLRVMVENLCPFEVIPYIEVFAVVGW